MCTIGAVNFTMFQMNSFARQLGKLKPEDVEVNGVRLDTLVPLWNGICDYIRDNASEIENMVAEFNAKVKSTSKKER